MLRAKPTRDATAAQDWLEQRLGQVLGGGPAAALVRAPGGLRAAGAPDVASLFEQLRRGLVEIRDPRTGRVRFVRTDRRGPSGEPRPGDESMAAMLDYLAIARRELAAVDPQLCRPGLCPEDLRAVLLHLRTTLETVAEAARQGEPARPLLDGLFTTLLERAQGPALFDRLECLLEARADPADPECTGPLRPRDADERQIRAVRAARAAVEAARTWWQGAPPAELGEALDLVRRCAPALVDRARAVRAVLAAHGIGRCELERAPLGDGRPTLAELLVHVELEVPRWVTIAGFGTRATLEDAKAGARRLRTFVTGIDAEKLVEALALGEDGAEAARELDRLFAAIRGFGDALDARGRDQGGAPPAGAGPGDGGGPAGGKGPPGGAGPGRDGGGGPGGEKNATDPSPADLGEEEKQRESRAQWGAAGSGGGPPVGTRTAAVPWEDLESMPG